MAEMALIAVGLSMDAFAASVCKGLAAGRARAWQAACAGTWFGAFQGLMIGAGYCLASLAAGAIAACDHWIAFGLLSLIGAGMIRDSFGRDEAADASFAPGRMLPLALATSIDAMAAGVTIAAMEADVLCAALLTAAVTALLSALGVWVGSLFGRAWRGRAELFGGCVLILLGVRILLEHLTAG